jgi:hypothetical protein
MKKAYHGSHNNLMGTGRAHAGMCFTESLSSAESYGDTIYTIDLSDLDIMDCDGYDRNENYAPADSDDYRAKFAGKCDVLRYDDEDHHGRSHTCYRIISQRAIDMVEVA